MNDTSEKEQIKFFSEHLKKQMCRKRTINQRIEKSPTAHLYLS